MPINFTNVTCVMQGELCVSAKEAILIWGMVNWVTGRPGLLPGTQRAGKVTQLLIASVQEDTVLLDQAWGLVPVSKDGHWSVGVPSS